MDPKNPTPSWCLICRRRLTPQYISVQGHNIPNLLCLLESLPLSPYDHKKEGHNGIYLHSPKTTDLEPPLSPHLTGYDSQEVDLKFPPIKDPKGRGKFNTVMGFAMPQVLEPVPEVVDQTLGMILNR